MSQVDPSPPSAALPEPPSRKTPRWQQAVVLALMAVLASFIITQGASLWHEYSALQVEAQHARATAAVGYPGIMPKISSALRPHNWYHEEGESTALWGGWQDGAGHAWFHFKHGEVVLAHLSEPIGRDSFRAIDHPMSEQGGGQFWGRIPDEASVLGLSLGAIDTVYPVVVLEKVLVVNDTVGDRPLLIVRSPYSRIEERTSVFNPVLEGRRITLGHSGYFHEGQPLLYDRGTESLWVVDGETLRAIAGKLRGQVLARVALLTPSPWSDWRSRHPASRLVVGADRSQAQPEL